MINLLVDLFKKVYSFLEREEGREKERERNVDQLPLTCASNEEQTHNFGTCPDRELSWQPFALQDDTQLAELHQPGLLVDFEKLLKIHVSYE